MTDALCINICVKHFGMANIKKKVYTVFYMKYIKLPYDCGIKMVASRPRKVKIFMALVDAENGLAMVLMSISFLIK